MESGPIEFFAKGQEINVDEVPSSKNLLIAVAASRPTGCERILINEVKGDLSASIGRTVLVVPSVSIVRSDWEGDKEKSNQHEGGR
ncbi:MAG: hypothetical protein C4293_11165 [Nitrospiraceae bacterium]